MKACGVCGTDLHIHDGEFIARVRLQKSNCQAATDYNSLQFPLIPGHEVVGTVAAVGKNVKQFKIGERVVADVSVREALKRNETC